MTSDVAAINSIRSIRSDLLAAAVRYINQSKDGTRAERLRTASSLSGVPIRTLELEAEIRA